MKRIVFFSFVYHFMILLGLNNYYQIKSCKINFVFLNGLQTGKKTLIFDNYGSIEREEGLFNTIKFLNNDLPSNLLNSRESYHLLTIKNKDSIYSIDLDSLKGTKDVSLGIDTNAASLRSHIIGKAFFLDRECNIIDYQGVKVWFWKGLALKKEFPSVMGNIYEYATSIDENYLIKKDEFSIPKNITFSLLQ